MPRHMGKNRALLNENLFESASKENNKCIFLSHATIDKDAVREIGEYIMKAGVDIYLDENDSNLQAAAASSDNDAITRCIEKGLGLSTDILCIISEKTKLSWWVPYEIGYGKKSEARLSAILLEDVTHIPSYLEITNLLKDIRDLNSFLDNLTQVEIIKESYNYMVGNEASLLEFNANNHPLSKYIKTNRLN